MDIFKMFPVFKSYLWGGNKLKTDYGKLTPYDITAESWEISSHKNGESTVFDGEHKGKTISELIGIYKEKLLGDKIYKGECTEFPLLIKLIDAKDNLSIQVHPDDEYAKLNENGESGKNEMWYILDADEGSKLIYGFKSNITKDEFLNAISNNILLDYVNFVECRKGDCFFIPAGTLHALGKGMMIAEIQQNSDVTYRVYDYNRRDIQGNTRELHIDKAVEVTDLNASDRHMCNKEGVIVDCPYFTTEKVVLKGEINFVVNKSSFETFIVCEGEIEIRDKRYIKGDVLLVPAYIGNVSVKGNATLLRTYIR